VAPKVIRQASCFWIDAAESGSGRTTESFAEGARVAGSDGGEVAITGFVANRRAIHHALGEHDKIIVAFWHPSADRGDIIRIRDFAGLGDFRGGFLKALCPRGVVWPFEARRGCIVGGNALGTEPYP
jgi:hypothetical protein